MATLGSLPAIDRCIETYLTAHTSFGDDPFSASELADREDALESSESDLEYLLTLLAAYGLVDRIDDDRYRVRCSPDESAAQWRDRAAERAEALHRLVTEPADRRSISGEPARLTRGSDTFFGVFVLEHDDVESVAAAAATALDRDDSVAGIVLRTSGARAGHAQRIADRLCRSDVVERTALESSFEKGFSDVVGESKDDLEFRSFLRIARSDVD